MNINLIYLFIPETIRMWWLRILLLGTVLVLSCHGLKVDVDIMDSDGNIKIERYHNYLDMEVCVF